MDIEKVGKAIAYLRKRAGYTQKELADRVGISDKAVSKWERGQGLPEIGYLRKLSILLDTDSDSLLAGDVAHHKSDWKGVILLEPNTCGIGAGTVIYDKPLINYLLSYFLLVGIKDIYIAGNSSDVDYINQALGSGEDFGIHITTTDGNLHDLLNEMGRVESPGLENNNSSSDKSGQRSGTQAGERSGADAGTQLGERSGAQAEADAGTQSGAASAGETLNGNIMMVHGRCILYGVDQTRFFQKAMVDRDHLITLALPKKMQKASFSMDVNKRVVSDEIKKLRTQYDFSAIPILLFPSRLLSNIAEAESIESYIEEQVAHENLFVETLDRGFVEIEVDDWNNVQEASTFMKIVQDKCGMNVYCLEEVAWRRGMISLSKLRELGDRKAGTEYGEYVLALYERLSRTVVEE